MQEARERGRKEGRKYVPRYRRFSERPVNLTADKHVQ